MVYRRELSGALHGLLRVRGFSQDDAHIFCAPEQLPSEVDGALDFALSLLTRFGFDRFNTELSVRDPANPTKYAGTDEFNLPRRFDVNYVASGGERRPVFMVHRALFGSVERFMGILTEHYAGAFPTWLAPVQCVVLPVTTDAVAYAERVREALAARGVRVELDAREEKIGYRVREAEIHKVPYVAVVGEREASEGAVAVRARGKGMVGTRPLETFVAEIVDEALSAR
jgi:threonyl-tRNA synthetase